MQAITNISLPLSFNQVVDLVRRMPEKQQKRLIGMIENPTSHNSSHKQFTKKEKEFLIGLDESVEFVNNYKSGITQAKTLQQLIDEL